MSWYAISWYAMSWVGLFEFCGFGGEVGGFVVGSK